MLRFSIEIGCVYFVDVLKTIIIKDVVYERLSPGKRCVILLSEPF